MEAQGHGPCFLEAGTEMGTGERIQAGEGKELSADVVGAPS